MFEASRFILSRAAVVSRFQREWTGRSDQKAWPGTENGVWSTKALARSSVKNDTLEWPSYDHPWTSIVDTS
jgi:hypothetical protein